MTTDNNTIIDGPSMSSPLECSLVATADCTSPATADCTCPVCACAFTDEDEKQLCETCSTPHHKDCWDYAEGCAIFGCRKGIIRKPSGSESVQTSLAR